MYVFVYMNRLLALKIDSIHVIFRMKSVLGKTKTKIDCSEKNSLSKTTISISTVKLVPGTHVLGYIDDSMYRRR